MNEKGRLALPVRVPGSANRPSIKEEPLHSLHHLEYSQARSGLPSR